MKQLALILFALLSHAVSISQENRPKEIKGFAPVFIGDPIARFKNFLSCIDASCMQEPFSDSAKCRSYRFSPDQKDSIAIGPLKFYGAVLFLDTDRKINAILYARKYDGKNRKAKAGQQDRDFTQLTRFFTAYFQAAGQQKSYPKSKFNELHGIVWKSGLYIVSLEKLLFKKAGMHLLHLTVSME